MNQEKNIVRGFNVSRYNDYVKDFVDKSIKFQRHIPFDQLRYNDLPDGRWFVKYCPDKTVTSWKKFVTWTGLFTSETTKDKAIEMIYAYQRKLNRPLYYDDFRGTNPLIPSISYINSTWGSLNKMKQELGLEVVQEDMRTRQLSKDDFDCIMKTIFEIAKNNDVDFITRLFIMSLNNIQSIQCIEKSCRKYYKQSLSQYINQNGYQTGKCGRGMLFSFYDGEITTSQFEYLFSKYLRSFGLIYNRDYYRDVKYSNFIDNYSGNMNCDYLIHYQNRIIYIEIPGIIEAYKDYYYKNKIIVASDSKEKYRLKLKEKEKLMRDNNLEYYILFPCDLTKDNINSILNNPSNELKHEIENFRKNNIDWQLVLFHGELKYGEQIKYGRNIILYDDKEVGD